MLFWPLIDILRLALQTTECDKYTLRCQSISKMGWGEIWFVLKIMAKMMVQDLSKMPKSAQAKQIFIRQIKMNTSGTLQFIHLVSKQTKFHSPHSV